MKEKKVVMVSGGFDPVHIGHVRLLQEAKQLGTDLVVLLNNDDWLKSKKGFVFMPEHERAEILEAFRSVDKVLFTLHPPEPEDMSVCMELKLLNPDVFANGGDRDEGDIPEYQLCEDLGIEMVFNVGSGGKVRSSSDLVKNAANQLGTCA